MPTEAIGVDLYNQSISVDKGNPLRSSRGGDSTPTVLIINSSGGGISGTIDAHYYKGQGEREGTEREYVVCKKQYAMPRSDSLNGTKIQNP